MPGKKDTNGPWRKTALFLRLAAIELFYCSFRWGACLPGRIYLITGPWKNRKQDLEMKRQGRLKKKTQKERQPRKRKQRKKFIRSRTRLLSVLDCPLCLKVALFTLFKKYVIL